MSNEKSNNNNNIVPASQSINPPPTTQHNLKESQTSQDLIEHQKNILKSILEQSRQPSAGAGLPAAKPKFTLNDNDHHFDDPPPLTPLYSSPPPNMPIKKAAINSSHNSTSVAAAAAAAGQPSSKAASILVPSSPSTSLDENSSKYLDSINEAKDRRQTWQQMHTQKSVRSYVPSLSIICRFFFLLLQFY